MSDTVGAKASETKRAKQGRSPAYPGIDLKTAVAKAQALFDAEGKYAAPMPSAFQAWGFSPKSSGAREIRAALKYFGLITIEGDGENGKVKLSEEALRILLDEREDQSEKKALLRQIALKPSIHKVLLSQFPEGIKSDATAQHFLVFDHRFNKSAASELIAEFKATAEYSGLFQLQETATKSKDILQETEVDANVGDLVQAEVNGGLVFENPKRVRAVQDREGQKWAFVDGSEAGIPMEQIVIVEKARGETVGELPMPPTLPLSQQGGLRPLEQGEREWLRGPLSKETSYRLIVSGNLGPKEIGKLIKLLQAQKDVLADDDDLED